MEPYSEIAREGDREALKNYSIKIFATDYKDSSELGMMDKAARTGHFDALDLKFEKSETVARIKF